MRLKLNGKEFSLINYPSQSTCQQPYHQLGTTLPLDDSQRQGQHRTRPTSASPQGYPGRGARRVWKENFAPGKFCSCWSCLDHLHWSLRCIGKTGARNAVHGRGSPAQSPRQRCTFPQEQVLSLWWWVRKPLKSEHPALVDRSWVNRGEKKNQQAKLVLLSAQTCYMTGI